MKTPLKSIVFEYNPPPVATVITYAKLRKTLKEVQELLLTRGINGGPKHLDMQCIVDTGKCGTAACIGGWTSILLLGFDKGRTAAEDSVVSELFDELIDLDDAYGNGKLSELFHRFNNTLGYNVPNVAATAIQRYLANKDPWPDGEMPNTLPYTRRAHK